ncbi:MAG: type II secretion system protein, partial [Candidatus Levyibacteriota bacterium]
MNKKTSILGFTLIELLVVIGVLAILLSITLIAINPAEQLHQSEDVSDKTASDDFIKANVDYFTSANALPWNKNAFCASELAAGGTLASMSDCVHELVQGGKLEQSESQSQQLKDIYASKCGSSAVLCYNPKSKKENEDAETKYDKFGNNNPTCPVANGTSPDCYVCRPIMNINDCVIGATPTPTMTPFPTNTPIPNTTATPTPTPLPTATPTPAFPQIVPGYANVQSKFLKTYAVYFFDYPGFSPPPGGWDLHLSLNSDFSGDWTQTNKSFGIPSQYGPEGPANSSYTAYRNITMKYVGFASTPSNTGVYSLSNCGKTLYYRIANYYSDTATNKLVGPAYTATFDCTTKVGMV